MIHSTVIFSLKPVSDHSCLVDGAFEILEEPHMFRHCLEGSSFSFNWPPICTSWGHIFFKNPTCKEMEQPFKARCRTTDFEFESSALPLLLEVPTRGRLFLVFNVSVICRYYRFNEKTRRVDKDYPKPISKWTGAPDNVKATIMSEDGCKGFLICCFLFEISDALVRFLKQQ